MQPVLTPGAYLARVRAAAGLTRDDVALMLETEPPIAARVRAEWLAMIERDEVPASAETLDVLGQLLPIDREVLVRLDAIHHDGSTLPAPLLCDRCAARADDALCPGCAADDRRAALATVPGAEARA